MLNSFAVRSITPLNDTYIWLLSSLAFLQCRALRSLMHRHPSLSNFLVVLTPLASLANPATRRVRFARQQTARQKASHSSQRSRAFGEVVSGQSMERSISLIYIVFIGEARTGSQQINVCPDASFARSLFTPDPLHPPRRWSTTNLSKRQMTLPLPVTHRG